MFLPDDMEPKRRSSVGRVLGRIQGSLSRFHAVPKTPAEREAITGLYDGSIRYLDDLVGDFYQWLGEAGVLEDTLLVITADHGENLGDHGLLGHGACLYETLIHVPLVCVHPTLFPPAQPATALVQASDVFPTVVDILGGDERLKFDSAGRSLLPDRLQKAPRSAVFSEDPRYGSEHLINTGLDPDVYNRALGAVRTHTWKYISGSDGAEELYNLQKDPNEQCNLIDSESEQASSLRDMLRSWQAGLQGFEGVGEQIEFDDVIIERLRDLGYIA
jgi:arylsulfatase A-like enzyme